jgi:putative oxidoreductase
MNESTASPPQASAARPSKGLNVALWCVQGLLALAFLGASSGKLLGKPEMIALFDAIGIGQWFRFVTGLLELAGAVLIVVPKTRSIGAGVLAGVMVGAIATHLFVLHNAPTAPLVLLLLTGFVLWGRRHELLRMLKGASR